jgi:hypothetical protein
MHPTNPTIVIYDRFGRPTQTYHFYSLDVAQRFLRVLRDLDNGQSSRLYEV